METHNIQFQSLIWQDMRILMNKNQNMEPKIFQFKENVRMSMFLKIWSKQHLNPLL